MAIYLGKRACEKNIESLYFEYGRKTYIHILFSPYSGTFLYFKAD